MRQLKDDGVAIIYISHRLAEIKQVADVGNGVKGRMFPGGRLMHKRLSAQIVRMIGRPRAAFCKI